MTQIEIKNNYLWLPVRTGDEMCRLTVMLAGQTVYELDIEAADGPADFYAWWDVRPYAGETLAFDGSVPAGWLARLEQHEAIPEKKEDHPAIHFTPHTGWMNDPNGLLFDGKRYHLYFQHNPFGTQWGNMHWGHAVSRDLLRWEQLDEAMYPDVNGVIFSGCGFVDRKNAAGCVAGAQLFFYTSMGGKQAQSKESQTTQRLALARPGRSLLEKTDVVCVPFIDPETRDPKVFYHAQTDAYVMVLFLQGNTFGIFRSHDLKAWEQTQTLELEKAWECPDLFQLKNESCMDRWVFISADGYYFVGDFDGYRFTGYTRRRMAYLGTLPYAAQTWANVNGRVLMTAWLRTANTGKPWRGTMSLPLELSLGGAEERLCLAPARELLAARQVPLCEGANAPCDITINVKAAEATLDIADPGTPSVSLACSAAEITFDIKNGTCTVGDETVHMRSRSFRVFFDCGTVEIFSLDDGGYYSAATAECGTVGTLEVRSDAAISLSVWPLG